MCIPITCTCTLRTRIDEPRIVMVQYASVSTPNKKLLDN